ncbi:MAG: amidohydrolase [Bacteroidia bacterium]|nr:amidohydrolase [Bacteroidia bacterium]
MKISIIQPDLAWEDKTGNFSKLEELILPLYEKTDIVVLPEMFNTGFSMNPGQLSELPQAETFNWMKNTAQKGNFGLCGSYMVKENLQFFNRWVFVSPENETRYYDKRHLFSMGEEDKLFSAGKTRLVFTFRGVRISPYICYDLRFPVWSRNKTDYDLMINSANWPESRINVWDTLLRARAIENQCFVAGANRIGTDGEGIKYCGDSKIINPRGEILSSASRNEEICITGEISMTELSDFREKFPVLKDADYFTINF